MKTKYLEEMTVGQFRDAAQYSFPLLLVVTLVFTFFAGVMGIGFMKGYNMEGGGVARYVILTYFGTIAALEGLVVMVCLGGFVMKFRPKKVPPSSAEIKELVRS